MDFNGYNLENLAKFHNQMYGTMDSPVRYVECAFEGGRLGNIILNIFSTFRFCLRHGIPFNRIIINRNTPFIYYYEPGENPVIPYFTNIWQYFTNLQKHIINFNSDQEKEFNLIKAHGDYINISFDANRLYHSDDKYANIDFNKFKLIRIHYFPCEFTRIGDYSAQDLALFHNLFVDKRQREQIFSNHMSWAIGKTVVGYSIRVGNDFKYLQNKLNAHLVYDDNEILDEVSKVFNDDDGKLLYVFSDNIEYTKNLLGSRYKNIKFHEHIDDYVDLMCLSLCDEVHGTIISSFISMAKIMNTITKGVPVSYELK